jgi:hypothetical protein
MPALNCKRDRLAYFKPNTAERARFLFIVSFNKVFGCRMLNRAVYFAESTSHAYFFVGYYSLHLSANPVVCPIEQVTILKTGLTRIRTIRLSLLS